MKHLYLIGALAGTIMGGAGMLRVLDGADYLFAATVFCCVAALGSIIAEGIRRLMEPRFHRSGEK